MLFHNGKTAAFQLVMHTTNISILSIQQHTEHRYFRQI